MKLIRIVIACAFIGQLLNAAEDATTVATKQLFEAIKKKSLDSVKAAIAQGADVNKFVLSSFFNPPAPLTSLGYAGRTLDGTNANEMAIVRYLFENGATTTACLVLDNGTTIPCSLEPFITPYLSDIFEREAIGASNKDLRWSLWSMLPTLSINIENISKKNIEYITFVREFQKKFTPIALKLIEQGAGDIDPSIKNDIGLIQRVHNNPALIKAFLSRGAKAISTWGLANAISDAKDSESLQLLLDQTKNIQLDDDMLTSTIDNQLNYYDRSEIIEKILQQGIRPSKKRLTNFIFDAFKFLTVEKLSESDAQSVFLDQKSVIQLLAQYMDPTIKYSKMIDGKMQEKSLNDILQDIAQKEKELA